MPSWGGLSIGQLGFTDLTLEAIGDKGLAVKIHINWLVTVDLPMGRGLCLSLPLFFIFFLSSFPFSFFFFFFKQ